MTIHLTLTVLPTFLYDSLSFGLQYALESWLVPLLDQSSGVVHVMTRVVFGSQDTCRAINTFESENQTEEANGLVLNLLCPLI